MYELTLPVMTQLIQVYPPNRPTDRPTYRACTLRKPTVKAHAALWLGVRVRLTSLL